jgi:lysophospholipase L1-like esterase
VLVGACSSLRSNEASGYAGASRETAARPGSNAGSSTGSSTRTGADPSAAPSAGAINADAKGAVTLIALGDSLTAGQGDDSERGFPARIADALTASGRPVSQVVNLGRSGWDSQQVLDGGDGDRSQLVAAQEAIAQARQEGADVIATVLVGSNDLWRLYDPEAETTAADERDNLERYRRNLQTTVRTLRAAGATVVVGINDDQSKRPIMADRTMRQNTLPGVTDDEVGRMSEQAGRYAEVVREVAAANGALVADFFDAPFFRNPATLNEDGIHPNTQGYDQMAKIWIDALETGR